MGRARARRPRSVEDRGRDIVRRRVGDGAAATTSCRISRASRTCAGRRSLPALRRSRINALCAAAGRAQRRASGRRRPAWCCCSLSHRSPAASSTGRAFRWLPVLILVGSVGFWERAHVLSPELGAHRRRSRSRLYGFALALRRPVCGRRRARRRHRARVPAAAACRARRGSPCRAALLPLVGRDLAHARLRGHARRSRSRLRWRLSLPWPFALHAQRSRAVRALVGRARRCPSTWRSCPAPATRVRCITCAICRGSRGRRCRSSSGCYGRAAAASTAACASRASRFPAVLALVIICVNLLARARAAHSATRLPLLVPLALLAALEVDSLQRGLLGVRSTGSASSRSDSLALLAVGFCGSTRASTACRSRVAVLLPRHRDRLPAHRSICGSMLARRRS